MRYMGYAVDFMIGALGALYILADLAIELAKEVMRGILQRKA